MKKRLESELTDLRQQVERLERERDALLRVITDTQEVLRNYPPFDQVRPGNPNQLVSQMTFLCNYYKNAVQDIQVHYDRAGKAHARAQAAEAALDKEIESSEFYRNRWEERRKEMLKW